MKIPPVELTYITETFAALAKEVIETYEDLDPDIAASAATAPDVNAEAMHRLLDLFRQYENKLGQLNPGDSLDGESWPLAEHEIFQLGDYGLSLLKQLSDVASSLKLEEESLELESLSFPLALWISRNGGEIGVLEPVVNSLARMANEIREPGRLEELCRMAAEVVDAVSPTITQATHADLRERPWGVLLANWAIIATRSFRPALMETAFDTLAQHFPDDAPAFFREGMGQMEALDYPVQVREVMARYFEAWSGRKVLH